MSYEPKRFDFSIPVRVNLSSDTQTKPSRGMKEAMMAAEVGEDQGGGASAIAGALILGLKGERGQFTVDTLEEAIRPVSRYSPTQRLVEVEQTANRGGGACWSVEALHAVTKTAHAHGLSTHMDGARLMNAAVALGVPATDLTEGCDSVWLDFTKGLAAPLGAVLAGSREFIGQAWRWKQRLGGSMRQ